MTCEINYKSKNRIYRQKMKLMLQNIKINSGCKNCGFKDHWSALDFHHRDPSTKLFNISENKTIGINKLLIEISKCDILCVNCHRRHKQ